MVGVVSLSLKNLKDFRHWESAILRDYYRFVLDTFLSNHQGVPRKLNEIGNLCLAHVSQLSSAKVPGAGGIFKTGARNLVGGLDWSLGFVMERHRDGASGHEKLPREILKLQGKMPVHIKTT